MGSKQCWFSKKQVSDFHCFFTFSYYRFCVNSVSCSTPLLIILLPHWTFKRGQ
ncbi:hypothetical protein WN944_028983 [Citrus x changshan-huyou]|uniref:Uncharacterized protein n=1 Tax=Citrus x changshan-huyou TaxID=2935761 RepID=A0AAP0LPW7_9ROSI